MDDHRAPGGGGGLPGRGPCWGRGRAGTMGAGVAGPVRRPWGTGAAAARAVAERRQQVAPFPSAASRPLGRGAAGGGVGARVCARVCAPWHRLRPPPSPPPRSVPLARRVRAALLRVRAPSLPPSSTILRSRVCDGSLSRRPPVGDGF